LRKPPPADPDAFVAAGPGPAPRSAALAEVKDEELVVRPDGRAFRELTVLLPTDLARRLSVRCMESDRDVSNYLGDLLRGELDGAPPQAPPPPPPTLREALFLAAKSSLWRFSPWAR